jgi:uncharacterized protein with PQ loop repeat
MNLEELSYVLSTISLIFYSIVYVPQFYVIYKSKSSDGISFWMLLMWTQADILSLIGTIVLYMPSSIVIIGWYHYLVGAIMIIFVLYYTTTDTNLNRVTNLNENTIEYPMENTIEYPTKNLNRFYLIKCFATTLFLSINTCTCVVLNIFINKSHDESGAILGWITMSFYLIGRIPQIWMNYKRKSTQGLSLLMYIFTMCGNGVYLAVITVDPVYIESNMPWIINCIVTILMDIFVICQYYMYK